jgi:predicted MFS family arabinose efflux permease
MLALGAVSYLVFMFDSPWAHVIALPLAFGAGWAWPGVFNLSVIRSHPEEPGRATGITQSGTYVGATCGPLLFGVLAERWSYPGAWAIAAVIGGIASLAVLNARRALSA